MENLFNLIEKVFLVFILTSPLIAQKRSFFDKTYELIAKSIYVPVEWFDNFFTDERIIEEEPTSKLRWITDFRFEQGGKFYLRTFVHINVRLPKASKKLKLIIEREEESGEQKTQTQIQTTTLSQEEKLKRSKIGFRYSVFYNIINSLQFAAGTKTGIPPKLYLRSRYRLNMPFTKTMLGRFSIKALWLRGEGWEEKVNLDFEKLFSKRIMLRWGSVGLFDLPKNSFNWDSSITYRFQFSPRSAFSCNFGFWGTKQDIFSVEGYRILPRYKSTIFRRWIFWEISPGVMWFREGDSFKRVFATVFRFEIQFNRKFINKNE